MTDLLARFLFEQRFDVSLMGAIGIAAMPFLIRDVWRWARHRVAVIRHRRNGPKWVDLFGIDPDYGADAVVGRDACGVCREPVTGWTVAGGALIAHPCKHQQAPLTYSYKPGGAV